MHCHFSFHAFQNIARENVCFTFGQLVSLSTVEGRPGPGSPIDLSGKYSVF